MAGEIFAVMSHPRIHIGRKIYHLYDCSGKEVIEREYNSFMEPYAAPKRYDAVIQDNGNGWYSLYTNPKHK